jgi:hypothetical protein
MNLPNSVLQTITDSCDYDSLVQAVRVTGAITAPVLPAPTATPVVDCAGLLSSIAVKTEEATGVVIKGTTSPLPVCLVNSESVSVSYKCDKTTGNTIAIRSVYDIDQDTWVTSYFDLVLGVAYAGTPANLEDCGGSELESDPIVGCDNGLSVTQWAVKKNGQPTGVVYYTSASGAVVTPTAWTPGSCSLADTTITIQDACATATLVVPVKAGAASQVIIGGTTAAIPVCSVNDDFDVEYTSATKLNDGTSNFYSREKVTIDGKTGALIPTPVTEYSVDGVVWTTTAPTGTLVIGWLSSVSAASTVEMCVVETKTIALDAVISSSGSSLTFAPIDTGTTDPGTGYIADFGQGTQKVTAPFDFDYATTPDGVYLASIYYQDANQASVAMSFTVSVSGGLPSVSSSPVPPGVTKTYEQVVKKVYRSFDSTGAIIFTIDDLGVAFSAGVGQTIKPCDECDCSAKPSACISTSELVASVTPLNNAGIEYWLRLDGTTPSQNVTSADINGILYDSVAISNMNPYDASGDFTPFLGQDSANTTVIIAQVEFYDPKSASNYTVAYAIPHGSKVIEMEGASIVQVLDISIANKMDNDLSGNSNKMNVANLSVGGTPTTPVNVLVTFNLSVGGK